jgi:multisubunit Na+/H+ antiporter MnhB subunit
LKISFNIKAALAAGILNCIAWYIIGKQLGFYTIAVDQYRYFVTIFLLAIGAFVCVYNERKLNDGYIDFKPALKTGVLYATVMAIILAVFNYIYYNVMVPDFVQFFISESKKAMQQANLSDDQIGKNLEVMHSYFGSFRMLMSTLLLGVIFSLLAAAVFRKKNKMVE